MEAALLEIIEALKAGGESPDAAWLDKLVRRHNRAAHDGTRRVAKKRLLPYYLDVKEHDPARWESWEVDAACEQRLVELLRAKPRRTASGVATVTVLTKPWPCSSDCVYCPNDVRMPKSYLADETACQRAERNFFDPYLQVVSRLRALHAMGHVTDKVELIVLGGTWSDYPPGYQLWFVRELFRALNDAGTQRVGAGTAQREVRYRQCGLTCDAEALAALCAQTQQAVNAGRMTYNQATAHLYQNQAWRQASCLQKATLEDVARAQAVNGHAAHRAVGLVVETRPDLITPDSLKLLRQLGCTKVQMGIQSLDDAILAQNGRAASAQSIGNAFALLRLFGFKIHVHAMVNLCGATPESDKADYARLVSDPAFCPDEVKLYPCVLVESARLRRCQKAKGWHPYSEEELLDVLAADVATTPAYTRISRMIRDISAGDIVAGNKKTNLRQLVEARLEQDVRRGVDAGTDTGTDTGAAPVREIRHREIATATIDTATLELECVRYQTTVSEERFLQWVMPDGRIAGFLRLSLPDFKAAQAAGIKTDELPVHAGEAMIREVHVYGAVAALGQEAEAGAQHRGLGRTLVEEACAQARAAGYVAINVISAVGTREYYGHLGFRDAGLYQQRTLEDAG